jgi:aspartate/methionine/tyrosine aminotransferase
MAPTHFLLDTSRTSRRDFDRCQRQAPITFRDPNLTEKDPGAARFGGFQAMMYFASREGSVLNHAIAGLGEYASKSIARRVEADANIVSLSIGEPTFGPPPAARERLGALLDLGVLMTDIKRYEASMGSPALRDAIASYHKTFFDLSVDPASQVLVTNGGAGALTAAILATSNPGDEVLVGDPSYMLYRRLVTTLGRTAVAIARRSDRGYAWDTDQVRQAITKRTAALIVNSPENPTGYACTEADMQALVTVCEERGLMLIHDEVYDQFCFSQRHQPAARIAGFDHVVQINSMSKKFGVPGLRMGWMISNPKVIAYAAKAQDYTTLAVSAFSEKIAEALLCCPNLDSWFAETRDMLGERVALTVDRLRTLPGIEFSLPIAGGMFAFPSVAGLARHLHLSNDDSPGDAVAQWMLEQAKVAVVPGSVYGREGAAAVRLVLCAAETDLLKGLDQIDRAVCAVHV